MSIVKLQIIDQVNCKFEGLDLEDRKYLVNKFKFDVPGARYLPAVRLGRWDGKASFFQLSGRTYINLLPEILTYVSERYELELEDLRSSDVSLSIPHIDENIFSHRVWGENHPLEGKPIVLKDYQVEHANKFIDNLQCIQEISTGAGKTMLTAALAKAVEPNGRVLVIVPTTNLVKQTASDFRNVGLDVGVFHGSLKEVGKTHTIATWQSLDSLIKRQKNGNETVTTIQEFLEDVVCVMVDEVQSAKANVLKEMLSGVLSHIPIRWGLTGTIPKDPYDFLNIMVCLGDVAGELTAKELQDRKELSSCHINILQLKDNMEFKTYPQEQKFLLSNPERLDKIASLIEGIRQGGNTLVLVDRIESGKELIDRIPGSVFISGKMKVDDRADYFSQIEKSNQAVLVATYGVASTGINIVRLNNVVFIEVGKSFVRTIQTIGRGLRKGFEKNHVEIWDITSNCKFSKRHLQARKNYYKDAQYPFEISKL